MAIKFIQVYNWLRNLLGCLGGFGGKSSSENEHISTRRVDFLLEGLISVEIKAIIKLEDVHLAQAINYLEAYDLEIGLLINFGSKSLEFKRVQNKKFKQANQGNPEIKRKHS